MRSTLTAVTVAVALVLTGCSSSDADPVSVSDAGDKIASGDTPSGVDGDSTDASEDAAASAENVEIVDYSFTQSNGYVRGIALLRANTDAAVGQFVTLSYNLLDADGQILVTEEQVESFSWKGQEVGFPIFASLDGVKGAKVATLDPIATFDADSLFTDDAQEPLPILEATSITGDGPWFTASFGFTNESDEMLESMRVAAVCFDKAGKIIGGETTYPDAAPGRSVRIDADMIKIVGGKQPASCKAYLNYPA